MLWSCTRESPRKRRPGFGASRGSKPYVRYKTTRQSERRKGRWPIPETTTRTTPFTGGTEKAKPREECEGVGKAEAQEVWQGSRKAGSLASANLDGWNANFSRLAFGETQPCGPNS